MATVNFLFRSTKQKSPLTARLLYRHLNKDYVFASRTNYEVEKEYWKKHYKNTKDAEVKNLRIKVNTELQKIEDYILDAFKETDINEISKEWLTEQIYYYYNPSTENSFSDLVTDVIQQIIEEAPYRENGKGGTGIGQCRVNDYKRLKEMFIEFQERKKYRTADLNNNIFNSFREWLLKIKSYSHTYSAKKISDLKGICKYARSKGLEVAVDLESVKAKQVSAYDDDMDVIILTPKEIEKIENTPLASEALINARKWLILGCYTGQRGKSLTTQIRQENFHKYGDDLVIKIIQKKGNNPIQIPVLPKVKEIYETGLPYVVSIQKLNKHFKEIGKIAELNDLVMGRVQEGQRGIKKLRPKYKYISTHIGRRSFASNHYGKIPTPIIMKVTGHSKESTLLIYINQSDDSHIDTFLDYYKTKELKEQKKPQLTIIREAQ